MVSGYTQVIGSVQGDANLRESCYLLIVLFSRPTVEASCFSRCSGSIINYSIKDYVQESHSNI